VNLLQGAALGHLAGKQIDKMRGEVGGGGVRRSFHFETYIAGNGLDDCLAYKRENLLEIMMRCTLKPDQSTRSRTGN